MTEFNWRPMRADDVDGVVAVAATAFPRHFEERTCFEERLALFPQGCFVLASPRAVRGYLIAYPWALGAIPPLNVLLGRLPETREAVYLHDLALHPEMRGRGHARPIVERLVREVRSLGTSRIALVSVNDTVPFWQSMGFAPVTGDAVVRKLQSYGDASTYMIREL
ncbi:MAG: GNAT family N-acetyltransferase [Novosphingobium sp.]